MARSLSWFSVPTRTLWGLVVGCAAFACGWDYEPTDNLLPEVEATTGTTGAPADTSTLESSPATFRFNCVEIQELGDAAEDNFQKKALQATWSEDVANYKLNILFDIHEEDESSGMGTVQIRSGIGTGKSDQCSEANTESSLVDVFFDRETTLFQPTSAEGLCSEAAADDASSGGTYTVDLGKDDLVYIYTEDDDGTPFNCSLDGGPGAIPVAGVTATLTMSEDHRSMSGSLNGCMTKNATDNVCSCLGTCSGEPSADCPGCPGGAFLLGALLGGIGTTAHCTELMGEPAFDITLGFTASRLAEMPSTCG